MKLTKKKESEVMQVYNTWWDSYLTGDVNTYDSFFDDNYRFVGSTNGEEFLNRKDTTAFFKATADQLAGKAELRNVVRTVERLDEGLVLITDLADAWVISEPEWVFYSRFRFSSLLRETKNGWRFIYQHFSAPDTKAQEGETLGTEQITKENQELRDAVKRRTVELEHKTKELEIEAALERVRAVAMGMKKPDDILEICKIMFSELQFLGFSNLRNTLINFWDDAHDSLIDYDYSDYAGGNKALLAYDSHPVFEQFQKKIKKSKDAFAKLVIKKDQLEGWKERRRESGEYEDPRLNTTTALYYYFYSIGVGAIGISTFSSITEEKLNVLERFRNVFDFAYRRYADVAQAEAQAREAKIETSLERVRSRTMAMHKSEEVMDVAGTLFQELQKNGFAFGASSIIIIDIESGDAEYWIAGFSKEQFPESYQIKYFQHPYHDALLTAWKAGQKGLVYNLAGEEKIAYDEVLFTQTGYKNIPEEDQKVMRGIESVTFTMAFMKHGALHWGPSALNEEQADVLQRFAKVFEQSYTRFMDLEKAEAQAREAQIEAALEKVRSRSLAMHKADELGEVITVVVEKLKELNFSVDDGVALITFAKDSKDLDEWMVNPGFPSATRFHLPYFEHPVLANLWKAKNKGEEFLAERYTSEENKSFLKHIFEHSDFKHTPQPVKDYCLAANTYATSIAFQKNTSIFINDYSGMSLSELEIDILKRFSKVFEQAYTRFLDLKKAEAQAREAQIEASLEKVRAHTMGMHASKDLSNVASVMFNQMRNLGGELFSFAIVLCDKQKNVVEQWHNIGNEGMLPPFFVPVDLDYIHQYRYDQWKAGVELFSIEIPNDYIARHFELMFELPSVAAAMAEATSQGIQVKVPDWEIDYGASFKHGYLLVSSFKPFTEDHIFPRFAKVFDQAYTRFLDLQKAEAQAREAHIEAALEKVRSRTMAMQKSDELLDVATVMFQQVKALGIPQWNCGFNIWNAGDKEFTYYPGSPDGIISPSPCKIPLTEHPVFRQFEESRKRGDELLVYEKEGEVQADHYRYMLSLRGVGDLLQSMLDAGFELPTFQVDHVANFAYGNLIFITYQHFPEMHDVFRRFAKVFEQTYTRFLDLQKAEAQAREAQIEAALERVRSRTMAMQKSSELAETSFVLFQQFQALGETSKQFSIGIFKEVENIMELYSTLYGSQWKEPVSLDLDEPVVVRKIYGAWKEQKKSIVIDLNGEDLRKYNAYRKKLSNIDYKEDRWVIHIAFFSKGVLTFSVTEPHPDETVQLLERFAQAFDLTYTRFNDLKKAEAQAREAQIEAALERVRSRTMGMQQSYELGDVAIILFKELNQLVENLWSCGFVLCDKQREEDEWWLSTGDGFIPAFYLPHTGDATHANIYDGWLKGETYHTEQLEGQALQEHYNWLTNIPVSKKIFDDMIAAGNTLPTWQKLHCAYFSYGYLVMITQEPCFEEQIFKRFAQVFDQTYTRFLDLQKAEAQAREARIETSLERLRSRTMAMHNSKDVGETVAVMFDELIKLGIDKTIRCGIAIMDESKHMEVWRASVNANGETGITIGVLDMTIHPLLVQLHDVWTKKESSHTYELMGENLMSYYKALNSSPGYPAQFDIASLPAKEINSAFLFREGALFTFSQEALSASTAQILKRFSGVFAQTYRRYLDLQKAEAQAREAQIGAALERVRSSAMAMHTSEGLLNVIQVLREQMAGLGEKELESVLIHVYKEKSELFEAWYSYRHTAEPDANIIHGKVLLNWTKTLRANKDKEQYYSKETDYTIKADYKMLKEWYEYLQEVVPDVVEHDETGNILIPDSLYYNYSKFSGGAMLLITHREASEDSKRLLKRSAAVFNLAYTRFLDLQRSEAQAREAQIELGLERVRSKAMAMQKSDELKELIGTLSIELSKLDLVLDRCFIMIYDIKTMGVTWWMSNPETPAKPMGLFVKFHTLPPYLAYMKAWEERTLKWQYLLEGTVKEDWDNFLFSETELSYLPEVVAANMRASTRIYLSASFNNFGCISLASLEPLSYEHSDILLRFAKVFDLTYTRFNDLQKAEAQAREAQIEAALERVRSRTLAMQKSDELAETAAVLFKQLINLGIAPNRLYIGIVKDDIGNIEFWVTDEDGSKVSTQFIADVKRNASIKKMYNAWKNENKSLTIDMHGKELQKYFHYLTEELHVPFKQGLSQKRRIQSVAFFSKGFIGIASPDEQPLETTVLLERFASVFNLTYTRFNDLQVAEAHAVQAEEDLLKLLTEKKRAEDALNELQATQRQLIQAEKMASLGELTAGIAHEIQNPLNFVNNFSEVNAELIEELKSEKLKPKTDRDEQVEESLLNDIVSNLEKINHHGKRADAIVKGMLQHSRSSSGQKELTDINALTDEYLRLAYHGLRAKDKSFNATLNTDYDKTIGKVNIIPQDIGRVILNLITNAFYAVTEKKKSGIQNYEPIVSLSTVRRGNEVMIRVKDNGNGIPKKIADKIFQPFFTTKPTGQGTGLGLSLSYDIVKAHGGELKLETKEGKSAEFILRLPIL